MGLPEWSAATWIAVVLSAFCVGISKTGVPGLGSVAVPLMAMAMPAKVSVGALLPILIIGDIFAVAWYRRHAVWSHLVRLIPWAVVGIVAGFAVMGRISDKRLKLWIGFIVLALSLLRAAKADQADDSRLPASVSFAAFMGILAGFTTMLANAAGPIMVLYLLAMRLPKEGFLGTAAWYFLLMNCFKVPFSVRLGILDGPAALAAVVCAPAVAAGAICGAAAARRMSDRFFASTAHALAAAAALYLVVSALRQPG